MSNNGLKIYCWNIISCLFKDTCYNIKVNFYCVLYIIL